MAELDQGYVVDVVYTDFSNAFDKLKECVIQDKVGCWLAAFLDSFARQQAVVVD